MSPQKSDGLTLDTWAEVCWPMLTVRPRTLADYQCRYRKNISPVLGSMTLDEIERRDVQAWPL